MMTNQRLLEGIVLSYVDGGTPKYRVFKTMERLQRFVGARALEHGRHDDHWNDSVMEGKVWMIDDAIKVEYDEDPDSVPEPKPVADSEKLAARSGSSGKRSGNKKHNKHHWCEWGCTDACKGQ